MQDRAGDRGWLSWVVLSQSRLGWVWGNVGVSYGEVGLGLH